MIDYKVMEEQAKYGNQKRKSGYYWILVFRIWTVIYYDANLDLWGGVENRWHERDFERIDENQIIKK